ncbi:ABATE domain-containing protein, partial [Streptomyces sp. NPDC059627]
MSERSPAPGGLALVEALVNTLDIESGADALDTADGRARLGVTEAELSPARVLRESLRAVLLAHAGYPPHREVTPLGELLAHAPLYVAVDPADGGGGRAPAGPAPPAAPGGAGGAPPPHQGPRDPPHARGGHT